MISLQKIKSITQKIRGYLTRRNLVIGGGLFIVMSSGLAYWPQTISFSYAGQTCVKQLTFLPSILQSSQDDTYSLEVKDTLGIAEYPLIGSKVCVKPLSLPREGEAKLSLAPFGIKIIGKTYKVDTPAAPVVSVKPLSKPLPAAKPVILELSSTDKLFTYSLVAQQRQVTCQSADQSVSCDIAELKLEQGQSHELIVARQFKDHVETVAKKDVDILPPVHISENSVVNDQIIYDKPKEFSVLTDKDLTSAKVSLVRLDGEAKREQSTKLEIINNKLIIKLDDDLERNSQYQLVISEAEAIDGSVLAAEHAINFKVSGGPHVTGVNVAGSGVDPNATIVLQLDQPLKPDQDIFKIVSFTGGSATISAQNDKIFVKLANLGRCASISVNVAKGLISQHDIVSDQEWKFNSKTRCHTISTIGYSVQGRPINAYYFGNGSEAVLFTGAIHGSELSSKYIMDSWIAELEAKSSNIPANKQIVIVPSVSPDGVATASRYNSRNINLNRNFPTRNWTSDIIVSGGRTEVGAGGKSALSEPESAALARFTQQLGPKLVVTYHSLGSLVNGNDVGIANTLGPAYAQATGYRYISNAVTSATFGFNMTGTYEDWLAERGTPAILVELNTNIGNHFRQNKDAMWAMVRG